MLQTTPVLVVAILFCFVVAVLTYYASYHYGLFTIFSAVAGSIPALSTATVTLLLFVLFCIALIVTVVYGAASLINLSSNNNFLQ